MLLRDSEMRVFFEPNEPAGPRSATFHYTPMSRTKHLYILRDVARLGQERGLTLTWPSDRNPCWEISAFALAHVLAQDQASGKRLALELSEARWLRGADVHLEETVEECLDRCNLDRDLASLHRSNDGEHLGRSILAQLDNDGVFGVPFMIVGRATFWGIDRIASASRAHYLSSSPAIPSAPHDDGSDAPIDDQPGGCG